MSSKLSSMELKLCLGPVWGDLSSAAYWSSSFGSVGLFAEWVCQEPGSSSCYCRVLLVCLKGGVDCGGDVGGSLLFEVIRIALSKYKRMKSRLPSEVI